MYLFSALMYLCPESRIHFEKVLSGGTNGRKKSRQDGYYLLKS
jgi:hypothetical protein